MARTTQPGTINGNGQQVIRDTGLPGTDLFQRIYLVHCRRCGHDYGANGSDLHERKCPECQGGRPGLEFVEAPASLANKNETAPKSPIVEIDEQQVRLRGLLQRARVIAKEYYQLTGRPLGITGEVAEDEACKALGLVPAVVRQAGFDAIRHLPEGDRRYQIKGRCLSQEGRKSGRLGRIDYNKEWDAVLLVILDSEYQAVEIWEAERFEVVEALSRPGSRSRNERGSLGIAQFQGIARRVWQA